MPTGDLKGDFINSAYSFARISGITKQPTSGEVEVALHHLESMAHEWSANNICTGYNFEDEPDFNSKHNVERKFWLAFQLSLAEIILIDKGKALTPELAAKQRGSYSSLVTISAMQRRTDYPTRMPLGSGNYQQYTLYEKFYREPERPHISCATNKMVAGQIDDFTESFSAYLKESEDIDTYTIESTSGIEIQSDSNTLNEVTYRVKALSATNAINGYDRVKITIATTGGRVEPRYINFDVSEE